MSNCINAQGMNCTNRLAKAVHNLTIRSKRIEINVGAVNKLQYLKRIAIRAGTLRNERRNREGQSASVLDSPNGLGLGCKL